MNYRVGLRGRAEKDLDRIDAHIRTRLLSAIRGLTNDMSGDVKRLTNFTPEYRLRVGEYRVLFEIEEEEIIIHRIKHRKDAYR